MSSEPNKKKKAIGLIVDSACGISKKDIESMGGYLLPIPIVINEIEYEDGINIDENKLTKILNIESKITTSSISISKWEKSFDEILKKYDKVICITLSKGLSSINNWAKIAAEKFNNRIIIIDSKLAAMWMNYGVIKAFDMIKNQNTINEIVVFLEEIGNKAIGCFTTDTLFYLKNGGRISSSAALIGNALKILPIVTWVDGKMDSNNVVKARTFEKSKIKTIECLKKHWDGINDKNNYEIHIVFSNNLSDNESRTFINNLKKELNIQYNPKRNILGGALIAHVGPNFIGGGILWKGENK